MQELATTKNIKNIYIFFLACFMAMLFFCYVPLVWHQKFYVDGLRIALSRPIIKPFGSSYEATAFVFQPIFELFKLVGVEPQRYGYSLDFNWFIINIIYAIIFWLGLIILIMRMPFSANLLSMYCILSIVVLFSPFYATINKDIIPFYISLTIVVLALYKRYKHALCVGGILSFMYGVYFRPYHIVFFILFLFTYLTYRRKKLLIIFYILCIVSIYLFYEKIPFDLINVGRAYYLVDYTSTRIEYSFTDDTFNGFIINRIIVFINIMMPIGLVIKSPAYAPFVLFKIVITIAVVNGFMGYWGKLGRFISSGIIAFSLLQSVFEPDYGGVFRHLIQIMPFIWVVLILWSSKSFQKQREVSEFAAIQHPELCNFNSEGYRGDDNRPNCPFPPWSK